MFNTNKKYIIDFQYLKFSLNYSVSIIFQEMNKDEVYLFHFKAGISQVNKNFYLRIKIK